MNADQTPSGAQEHLQLTSGASDTALDVHDSIVVPGETEALLGGSRHDDYEAFDLDSHERLERLDSEPAHVGGYIILAGTVKILSLAVLAGSILTEMQSDALSAPLIAAMTSGTVVGLSIIAPMAITHLSINDLPEGIKKIISLAEIFNLVMFGSTLILAGLAYQDVSTDWTGGFALATVALTMMSTMAEMIVLSTHMCPQESRPSIGLSHVSSFQPAPVGGINSDNVDSTLIRGM